MNVVVLVPRRADGGHRDRLWTFARQWWLNDHPDWPIIEGHHDHGPFNRAAAVNSAAAGDWDVAVIIDADIIANPDAVRAAVDIAANAGRVVVSHHDRVMLNKAGTQKILEGYRGPWRVRNMVETVFTDSVSCAVVVPRPVWDDVGGFDERFSGWGFEDSAFAVAVETLSGKPIIRLASELYHLHHPPSPEASKQAATYALNADRLARYRAADGDPESIRALLAADPIHQPSTRIPRILHRTTPADTSPQVEAWWAEYQRLHPGWDCRTYREPIDPAEWPLTGDLFDRCQNGAQKAGLIRLEALHRDGGVYVDSDCEPFRSFEPLLQCDAFAAWEDETTVPDAVLGARPGHPAFEQMIQKARASIEGGGDAWLSGPGVTTETLPGRHDVLLLPPGAFYPHHYLEKHAAGARTSSPWVFCEHKWHHSWGTPSQRASIDKRQRR